MKIIILVLTYLDNDVYSKLYQKQNDSYHMFYFYFSFGYY